MKTSNDAKTLSNFRVFGLYFNEKNRKCRKQKVTDVLNPTVVNISHAIKLNSSVEISTEFSAH